MNSNQEEKNDLFDEQVNMDHKEVKPMFTNERTMTKAEHQKLVDKIINGFPMGVGSIQYETPFDNGQKNELND